MSHHPAAAIPHIIHQVWYQGAAAIPGHYRAYADGWTAKHPTWEYRLWDRAAGRALIAEQYPQYLDLWEAYPLDIQRIDTMRYFILHAHGGVYLDMDIECLKPIDPLLEGYDFLVSHAVRFNNAVMASSPGHAFWPRLFHGLVEADRDIARPRGWLRLTGAGDARYAVQTAGPAVFSRVIEACGMDRQPSTHTCPGYIFEPYSPTRVDGRLHYDMDTSRSYAIHHESMGWMSTFHRGLSLLTRSWFRFAYSRRQ